MNKIVAENLNEYRESKLNEDQVNELNIAGAVAGAKSLVAGAKSFLSGTSGKDAIINFFKANASKTDIDDKSINDTFNNAYSYSFGKNPQLKQKAIALATDQKYKLLQASKAMIDKDPSKTQVILNAGTNKWQVGLINTTGVVQPGQKAAQ
jgi:hypothetical protein